MKCCNIPLGGDFESMSQHIRFLVSLSVSLLVVWSAVIEANSSDLPLVVNQNIKLTNAYVKQAFASSKREVQDAVISNQQRFQKYIENRWVELNLINQLEHGAVPDSMPDLPQLLALIQRTTIAELMIKKLAEDQDQGLDLAAKQYYQENMSNYKMSDRVKASHILIKSDDRSEEEARVLANEVRIKVVSGKQTFAALAQQYSDDPTVYKNSGDLGFFSRGQMAKAFEEAVFAMQQTGEISPVVKTQFGYHIIRFMEKQEGKTNPFSAVQNTIKDKLSQQRQQVLWKQYADKVANTKDKLVSNDQVNTWLWFGEIDNADQLTPVWKDTKIKLSIATLLENLAIKSKYDQSVLVKQRLESEQRESMIKLRRRALFEAIAKRNLETAIKEQYLVKKDQFIAPLQVDVSLIFLSKQNDSNNEVLALADSIHLQLTNGKSTLEALALKYSDAPGVNKNKGNLGLRKQGELGKQLDSAIFAQEQPGIISPIETPEGVFIVKINKIHPQHQLSLDEMKDSIKATIVSDLATQEYARLVQSILSSPDNKVNQTAVEQLYAELKEAM